MFDASSAASTWLTDNEGDGDGATMSELHVLDFLLIQTLTELMTV